MWFLCGKLALWDLLLLDRESTRNGISPTSFPLYRTPGFLSSFKFKTYCILSVPLKTTALLGKTHNKCIMGVGVFGDSACVYNCVSDTGR